MMPLTVFSCGVELKQLPHSLKKSLEQADLIYGASKLLNAIQAPENKSIVLGKHASTQAQEALSHAQQEKNVLILCSGDALFHGIGGTIARLNNNQYPVTFIPAPTAFQTLFHRLGLSWDDAQHFSVHNSQDIPLLQLLSHPLSIIYGGTHYTASTIAQHCIKYLPASAKREAVIACDLGTKQERIYEDCLDKLQHVQSSPTSILLLLPSKQTDMAPILPLGKDNTFYNKESNLITQEDVRTLVLAKLQLPAWGTLWDIGAGSGSVGLEAAALRPHLNVIGLEQNKERCIHIIHNKKALGITQYQCIQGKAPEALEPLPAPDRVFIGGGGAHLFSILEAAYDRISTGGILVATAVTLETFATLSQWHPEYCTQLISVDIAISEPIAQHYQHLKHQHRIYIFTFKKS